MVDKITVHEPDDVVYTMDGYGRVRAFTVLDDGGFTEEFSDGEDSA